MDISSLRERQMPVVLTVTELNENIKSLIERAPALSNVTVRGEISNFTFHTSGHIYFSLKDEGGVIKAVMFRASTAGLKFIPTDGMKVIVTGSVSVYVKSGAYQIYVKNMQPDGVGGLYLAYEQLKEKLDKEGLFSQDRKHAIPACPSSVGVITSPTGAAVRDIIEITGRRFSLAKIYLYPSLVQGDGAEDNLIRALDYFDRSKLVDVVIIGRGGGSIEDLWAFNSEKLARKIADATVPVISAVGHETDFTICDFVADLRAPTPSAAAEQCVPDSREIYLWLDQISSRLSVYLEGFVNGKEQKLKNTILALSQYTNAFLSREKNKLALAKEKLQNGINIKLTAGENELSVLAEKANSLSPLSVLGRGYALALKDGVPLRSVSQVKQDDALSLRLKDGVLEAKVTKTMGDKV